MDLDKKKMALKAYSPYYKEALHCFEIYVIIFFVLLVIFAAVSYAVGVNFLPLFLCSMLAYLLADCVINYRLSFLAVYERKSCNWIEQELTIVKITTEFSWSAHWSTSVIPKLYPKSQGVDKYKIICKKANGEKIVLRTAMGGKKYQIIQDRLFESLPTNCKICYGRYTKIIMYYKNGELWTDKLNHMF